MYDGMQGFLSIENLNVHKEYYRRLKLRYSILEKSLPDIKDKGYAELVVGRMKKDVRMDVIPLKREILFHEIYFSSFGGERRPNPRLRREYGSEEKFLYELLMAGENKQSGFLLVYDEHGRIVIREESDRYSSRLPILAIDMFEHAYFLDYGFDGSKYLQKMLPHIKTEKI